MTLGAGLGDSSPFLCSHLMDIVRSYQHDEQEPCYMSVHLES